MEGLGDILQSALARQGQVSKQQEILRLLASIRKNSELRGYAERDEATVYSPDWWKALADEDEKALLILLDMKGE